MVTATVPGAGGRLVSHEETVLVTAMTVVKRLMNVPSPAIPFEVVQRAKVLVVIPGAMNRATASVGEGVASARLPNGMWSGPAMIEYSGRISPTIDAESVDLIFVALSRRGTQYVLDNEAVSGRLLTIPRGPVDRDRLTTDNADIVGYVRFGDFFAGISVDQWSLCDIPYSNARLYGNPLTVAEVFRIETDLPVLARAWRDTLMNVFNRMS